MNDINIYKPNILFKEDNIFFTSDTHFFHENIIKFCHRPYNSVEEMNLDIINKWNTVIPPEGIVFHLGDFAFGGFDKWIQILEQLNGTKILILGNHDYKIFNNRLFQYFESVIPQMQISVQENDGTIRQILLNHYPILCYGGDFRGVWQLYGHVHSGKESTSKDVSKLKYLNGNQIDVGVDSNEYYPYSYYDIRTIINCNNALTNILKKY